MMKKEASYTVKNYQSVKYSQLEMYKTGNISIDFQELKVTPKESTMITTMLNT